MDEMPQVQNAQNGQAESARSVVQTPFNEPPREHGRLRKIFNASSWFVLFTFLPVTVLILISQNTIPGDLFYPIKRSMENVILAAATVSPATRAAFRTDLTERRFTEAEKLLLARKDTTGLDNFIEEVTKVELEIAALSNQDAKKDVTEKLIKKIDEYQSKLVAIEIKNQETRAIALSLPTKIPTSVTSKKDTSQVPTSGEKPAIIVTVPKTSSLLTPTTTILEPTLEPTSTTALSYNTPQMPTPVESDIKKEDEIAKAIDDTQDKLDEIKKQLEEESHEDLDEEGDQDESSSEVRKDKDHPSKEKDDDDEKDGEKDKEKEKKK